jgi:hypothetical protein
MDEMLQSEPGPPLVPFYKRPAWRGAITVAVVLLILLALWVAFPSEYWRF